MGAVRAQKPRVLAFADGRDGLVSACRVRDPLEALQEAGLVGDYVVTDATLEGAPRAGSYDVVWLQRGADPWLTDLVAQRLAGRFLLDLDDHLLVRPSYVTRDEWPDAAALTRALEACRVLTVSSCRLTGLLESRSGRALSSKAHICRNAVAFGRMAPPPRRGRPAALLLAQGHRLALTTSAEDVLGAIASFAHSRRMPIWYVGSCPPQVRDAASAFGARLEVLRLRRHGAFDRALAGEPTLLALAPLETRGDEVTNEFVSGKSDIKMVEYGGCGHPAVFSAAAPYLDSDLQSGELAENTFQGWSEALEAVATDWRKDMTEDAAEIRQRRDMARVAMQEWWPAVEAARLERPVRIEELLSASDRMVAAGRSALAKARWKLRRP
jgi:hypothetical protein